MKLFWGLIVVAIGFMLLGENLGWWTSIDWSQLWALWPLFLIAIGARMAIKSDSAFTVVLLAVVIAGAIMVIGNPVTVSTHRSSMRFDRNFEFSTEKADFDQSIPVTDETVSVDLGGHYKISIIGDPTATAVTANLTGPKDVIDNLRLTKDGQTIVLNEARQFDFNFLNPANYDQVEGTITIPAAPLKLDLSGLTTINLSGTLDQLTVKGSGAVTLDALAASAVDPIIDLSGAGTVKLGQCSGTASFELSGAGKINAESCNLESLTAQLSGAGEISIDNGTIVNVDLKSSGAAKIRVPRPTGSIKQDNSGAGTVEFTEPTATTTGV